MKGFNYKKAVQALAFFAIKSGGKINKMKAIKLIWLSDRLHLRKYARTITGDIYFALPYGPVASTTRDLLQLNGLSELEDNYTRLFLGHFTKYEYSVLKDCNFKVFSETDLECLNAIFEKFGDMNEFDLSSLSHEYPEWKRYEKALMGKTISRVEIEISDFFINPKDTYTKGLFNETKEYLDLSKEMFETY